MDRCSFLDRLARASAFCREFTSSLVLDVLPCECKYFVLLNQSYDGNPLREGEVTFPDDLRKHGDRIGPIDAGNVVSLLWREGKVPEWIDISVGRSDEQSTYFELLCCGRFADQEDLLYYTWNSWKDLPVAPFGVKGPAYPRRLALAALDGQVVEKFWLRESRPDFPLYTISAPSGGRVDKAADEPMAGLARSSSAC